jgi:PhnB protein
MPVKPIPDGFHTLTPACALKDCARAIDFYKKAFAAKEHTRFDAPDGTVMHAELQIGDSIFMVGEASKTPVYTMRLMMYVQNCDAVFKRAVETGATAKEPPADQFYGDRMGRVQDPFGNEWLIATHKEDVSPEEMQRRIKATMSGAPA